MERLGEFEEDTVETGLLVFAPTLSLLNAIFFVVGLNCLSIYLSLREELYI